MYVCKVMPYNAWDICNDINAVDAKYISHVRPVVR